MPGLSRLFRRYLHPAAPRTVNRWAARAGGGYGEAPAGRGDPLTNLDQPLFDGADATKRDLVDEVRARARRMAE